MPVSPSDIADLIGPINEDDILEFADTNPSPRVDRFSYNKADLDMVYKIPGTKLRPFLAWMLGVDYVVYQNGTYSLRRTCPAFHPVHCWAWCNSVQAQGQAYRGDEIPVWPFQNAAAKWEQYTCQATYSMPSYHIRYDDNATYGGLEYKRFVTKTPIPKVEMVTVDGGQIILEANAADAWNNKPWPSIQPLTRRQTAGYRLKWYRVPLEWVQADYESLPTKLMQVQGCENSDTFLGCAPGTLACFNVDMGEPYVSPLLTDVIGELYFMYDITIDLMFWSQESGSIGKTGETRRGWNLHLGPTMKYWYGKNSVSSKPVWMGVEFAKMFTHHADTFTFTP